MSKLLTFISAKVLPNLILLLITGVTVGAGVYSATKVSDPTTGILNKSVKEVILGKSDKNVSSPNNTVSNNGTANNNEKLCLVKISGKIYNVYSLRTTHSGGDIFTCNTDMTQSYISQHGSNLSRMEKYIYSGPAQNVNIATNPTSTSTNVRQKTSNGSTKIYDSVSLKTHNTSSSCFVAYNGTVYNVTNNPQWNGCYHHGIKGGIDISSLFPHPVSYLSTLPVVGKYSSSSGSGNVPPVKNEVEHEEDDEREESEDHDESENEIEEVEIEHEFNSEDD